MSRIWLWVLCLLALPTAGLAQEDKTCRNGLFGDDPSFTLAHIKGEGRAFLHSDLDGCPSAGLDCRTPRFLIAGDEVIISKISGEFACAFYFDSASAGWVNLERIEALTTQAELSSGNWARAWAGIWAGAFGAETLGIYNYDGRLSFEGKAFWHGGRSPSGDPIVHGGEIWGSLPFLGNRAQFQDNDCAVTLTLLGNYLIAGDNRKCGGANVSFTSVYKRQEYC